MKRRRQRATFVADGMPAKALSPMPRIHEVFDEKFLQDQIAATPAILPIDEIRPDAGNLILIGREIAVPSGRIDLLSTNGYPVLVETKLCGIQSHAGGAAKGYRRLTLSEADLLSSIEAECGPEVREQIRQFCERAAQTVGLEQDFKASAVMLKLADPDDEKPGASLLAVHKTGCLYNPTHMRKQVLHWRLQPEEATQIVKAYWAALHAVDPRFGLSGMDHAKPQDFIPFVDLADKLEAILDAMTAAVATIKDHLAE